MIYVVRHGQTDWDREGRLQGRQGLPLNAYGIQQAERLRDSLQGISFDYVFSSPQVRAIQTAEIVTGKKAIVDVRLDVFDIGEADGLPRGVVRMAGIIPDPEVYRGVEDIRAYLLRVFSFIRELETAYGSSQANILISGHQCTTSCIGGYFEGVPGFGNLLKHAPASGKYKRYALRSVNAGIVGAGASPT